jgi:hypothetical protein
MYIRTIDIAHPPLTPAIAEKVLDEEAGLVLSTQPWRVLKIIHGHGTDQRPSVLKQIVYNWAHQNRKRLRALIPGENYSIHDSQTQEMRKYCGQVTDADLDVSNSGITLIWIK